MKALKSRPVAALLTAVIVLLSLTFGVHRSVTKQARRVETMFTQGVDGSGYGIEGDLDDRADSADVLCKLAAKYGGAETESAAVQDALAALAAAKTPSEKYAADRALTGAVTALDLALAELPLSEQDADYRSEYMAMLESRALTITREAAKYNEEVRQYESDVLGGLPVKLLGRIAFLPDVEAFE